MQRPITILNGPMGTELIRRGVELPEGPWSAAGVRAHRDVIGDIHREYAGAGASVHTACTFRTQPRFFPAEFGVLTAEAVALARASVPRGHMVAGSLGPIADCYDPRGTPEPVARPLHRLMAEALRDAGADLIVCETFPNVDEAMVGAEEALRTGLPVWVSFTSGPRADLLSPEQVEAGARRAASLGAVAVLVNCVGVDLIGPLVKAAGAGLAGSGEGGVRLGVYANAGEPGGGFGWGVASTDPTAAERYAAAAASWIGLGATIVGACCGTGPAHIAALARSFGPEPRG